VLVAAGFIETSLVSKAQTCSPAAKNERRRPWQAAAVFSGSFEKRRIHTPQLTDGGGWSLSLSDEATAGLRGSRM